MTITSQSAAALLEYLESLKNERDRWGVAILNGSKMDPAARWMLLSADAKITLADAARDAGMAAFICHDADVVLLFSGSSEESWPALQGITHELLPHLAPGHTDLRSLFTFFELKYDFDLASRWIEKKAQVQASIPAMETLRQEQAWDAEQFSLAAGLKALRKKPLILIAEDSASHRQLAKSVLKQTYEVVLARDGVETLALYNVCAPDLLFLDIAMPRLDGVSVLQRLMVADPAAQVVMFSTQSNETMLRKALSSGAKGFVAKPFTADALMQYAGKILAHSQSR